MQSTSVEAYYAGKYQGPSLSINPLKALELYYKIREEKDKRIEERDIAEELTRYVPTIPVPTTPVPISREPGTTDKLVAQILPRPVELFVDKIALSSISTIDLIHQAVEELHGMPTLVEISLLRWMAHHKQLQRFPCCYHGIIVPYRPADRGCEFDVRVYGYRA